MLYLEHGKKGYFNNQSKGQAVAKSDNGSQFLFPNRGIRHFHACLFIFIEVNMPYANIVYVKLFLELFDKDDRFLYGLTERQQLLYIKLLYLAGRQDNKITKNSRSIIQKINYQADSASLLGDIKVIKNTFKKFKESKYYYTFLKFETLHNFKIKGNSKGNPKEIQRGSPDVDVDLDVKEEEEGDVNKSNRSAKRKTWLTPEELTKAQEAEKQRKQKEII